LKNVQKIFDVNFLMDCFSLEILIENRNTIPNLPLYSLNNFGPKVFVVAKLFPQRL